MEGTIESRVIRGRVRAVPLIDPTLRKAGQAADAKAAGDFLRTLAAGGGASTEIIAHMESRDNPHSVTAAQLGLGKVNNTADADKPVSLAQQAAIADACGAVRNAALLKSGGTMAGQLSMGGCKLTGLAAPEAAGDGVNKAYADGKRQVFSAVIPASGWSDGAPFANRVAIPGIRGTDLPHVTAEVTGEAIRESWSFVTRGVSGDGFLTFTALADKPETDIPIQVEVLR